MESSRRRQWVARIAARSGPISAFTPSATSLGTSIAHSVDGARNTSLQNPLTIIEIASPSPNRIPDQNGRASYDYPTKMVKNSVGTSVNTLTRPMQVREEPGGYGGQDGP